MSIERSEDLTGDFPWLKDEMKRLRARVAELEEASEKLKAFARHIIECECWDLCEPDGGDTQDLAEKLGLIEPHVATEQDVDEEFSMFDVGDTIYRFSPILEEKP